MSITNLHFAIAGTTLAHTMTAAAPTLAQFAPLPALAFLPPGAANLLVAAVLLYAVGRSMVELLTGRSTDPSPARLAGALATPVVVVGAWAAWHGEAGMALGVVLGAALASVTLVAGAALVNAHRPVEVLPPGARTVQFLLPVALVLLVIGFGARIGLTEAALLALLGMVILGVYREDAKRSEAAAGTESTVIGDAIATDVGPVHVDRLRPVRWGLTVALAIMGGWLASRAGIEIGESRRMLSPGVVGVTLLSTLVTLPAVGVGTALARTGRAGGAITAAALTAVVLLAGALPLTVVVWHLRGMLLPVISSVAAAADLNSMPYGIGLWRIETLLLVALSLPLVPISLGRWLPGRVEGVALMAGYVFYLLVVVAAGDRWH